jgi:hypothetical protein
MHDSGPLPAARSSDSLGSRTSLWDLRCEILSLLEKSRGAVVEVPKNVLQRVRMVMREHVRHRMDRRALAQRTKVRFEVLV